jgi:phage-related baseplate assembly protein
MTLFADVDLASLPKPDVIAVIDYDTVRSELIADYLRRYPDYSAETLELTGHQVIEVAAYRETILRQRVNDVCPRPDVAVGQGQRSGRAGADAGVYRLTLDPAIPMPHRESAGL